MTSLSFRRAVSLMLRFTPWTPCRINVCCFHEGFLAPICRNSNLITKRRAVWMNPNSWCSLLGQTSRFLDDDHLIGWRGYCTANLKKKEGIQQNILALQAKKRVIRRKAKVSEEIDPAKKEWSVVAHSTAEEYDLEAISKDLVQQGLYQKSQMLEDIDVLHVIPNYETGLEPREFYLFREGSVVFWNVPEIEILSVLQFLKKHESNSYDESLIELENEVMEYVHTENKTNLINGKILLHQDPSKLHLEKYTFSNSMALSVKLAIWEASLDRFIESIESIAENMKDGKKIDMTRNQVFRKTGELFSLRHLINLSSDLLDTPDFYWDRDDLENLYLRTCSHFNTAKRTRVMNEKISHCCELMELLSNHLNDNHHVRLELMIIALIMVEVVFEFVHYLERFM